MPKQISVSIIQDTYLLSECPCAAHVLRRAQATALANDGTGTATRRVARPWSCGVRGVCQGFRITNNCGTDTKTYRYRCEQDTKAEASGRKKYVGMNSVPSGSPRGPEFRARSYERKKGL
eukprot:2565239-Pleurochrysis_carterae.AAC.3